MHPELVCDGVTDDSAALQAAYAHAVSSTVDGAPVGSNRRGRTVITLPPGRILVTEPSALMGAVAGARAMGFTIEGAGRSLTEIVYRPATPGEPLLRNDDTWMHVTIRGVSFVSDTPGANFMHSSSNGGAQDYLFEECSWSGDWGYGLGLDGTTVSTANNNSEIEFRRCTIAGTYRDAFLWSGMTSGNTQQDQFLNFTFGTCNVFLTNGGTFARFDYGGAIYFREANVILDHGATLFDLRGSTHAYGVQLLTCTSSRIELRSPESKTIVCGWGRGTVLFSGVDEEANVHIVAQDVPTHIYDPGAWGGPTVRYESCAFSGRHEYAYGANSYLRDRSITYDGCTLPAEPHRFIVNTGSTNPGGRAVVTFRRTRTRAEATATALDQTLGWWDGIAAQPERRAAVFRSSSATLHPTAKLTLRLPLNAVVTAVRFHKRAGGTDRGKHWSYTVAGAGPLATCAGGGVAAWADGFTSTVEVGNYVCDTDERRTLSLTQSGVKQAAHGVEGFVLVEYIA